MHEAFDGNAGLLFERLKSDRVATVTAWTYQGAADCRARHADLPKQRDSIADVNAPVYITVDSGTNCANKNWFAANPASGNCLSLAGGPGWLDSDHYDIQAKADGSPSVQQMEGPMLRALLEERFKLLVHRETRQLAFYKLSAGKSGAKLQASQEGSCTPYAMDGPPPTTKPGEPRPIFCGFQRTSSEGLNRSLDGKG